MEAFYGILIPFLGTSLGAACVFFLKKTLSDAVQRALTGFAAGVMVAASVWSLLIPAIAQSAALGRWSFLPAALGFWAGILFLLALDHIIPHLHAKSGQAEGPKSRLQRTTMMVLAVTLHNIPEGMAVGVVYAGYLSGQAQITAAGALALSLGAQDMKAFFHLFSLMTALCVSFNWTLSFPILFSRTARHLMMRGSALAGWSGARDVGRSRRLVLTDTDIFPEDAIEITGVRFMDKSRAAQVLGITGSMLDAAGTGLAAPFAELMRRKNAAMQTVEDFSVGEGGAKGMVQGEEVRIGTLAYMHLSGVKIPDKIKEENALYTAVSGELAAVFPLRYRPMASVQRALAALRREHRKPIFAVRDFNLDPLLPASPPRRAALPPV